MLWNEISCNVSILKIRLIKKLIQKIHVSFYSFDGNFSKCTDHLSNGTAAVFAFSTIIGWGLYGSRFLAFLCHNDKVVRPFFVVYSFVSILGATVDLGLLWSVADTFNGLMSIPNLIALLLLSGTVVNLTKEFFASEKANG